MNNKIITFYSYKGGSGRSQLVANLASYLAFHQRKKILLIDWDLEAPGLDFFFRYDRKHIINDGLIEVFQRYVKLMNTSQKIDEDELPFFDNNCIYNIIKEKGSIDFIPAANYNLPDFHHKINSFDWFDFYNRLEGRYYIEFLKSKLYESKYDYIFLDSRTGISDYSGICNIQIPDVNVIVVAPTFQNIEGSYDVSKKILESPYTIEKRPDAKIIPILSRIDFSDNENYKIWQVHFLKKFSGIIIKTFQSLEINLDNEEESSFLVDKYIKETTVNYDVNLSYGEKLLFNNNTKKFIEDREFIKDSIEEKYINIWGYIDTGYKDILLEQAKILNLITNNITQVPHHLTPPPFLPEIFLGREEELATIHQKFSGGTHLLFLVNGEGGVGKTALASKYYHTYHKQYTHAAWVLSEESIANALLSLAQSLKITLDDITSQEDRLEKVLSSMASLPQPCLLVIDNANDLEDLEENYIFLRRFNNFHILLTTRITDFHQAEQYKTESLSERHALILFKEYYPKHEINEDEIFKQIYYAVGGNTLVIEILAKNLNELNKLKKKYQLNDLLIDLQQKGLLALSQSKEVDTDYHRLKKAKPQDIIEAMYDLGQLSSSEIALLSIFAVLPPESISFEILEDLLSTTENLEDTLLILAKKGWLDYNVESSTFKCSPVIQDITQKKNTRLFEDCANLINVLIEKLKYEAGTGNLINIKYEESLLYSRYAESIINSFENIHYNLALLCEKTGNYYKTYGNIEKALQFFKKYSIISEKLSEDDSDNSNYKHLLAISYKNLGEIYQILGDFNTALNFFKQYNQLHESLFRDYPNEVLFQDGLSISYLKLGELYQTLGNYDTALDFFRKQNQLNEELYRDYPNQVSFKNGLAISYEKLGELNLTRGNLTTALEFFQKYNQLNEELYIDYPNQVVFKNGLAISYLKLGELNQGLGSLDNALDFLLKYNQLIEEIYRDYPNQVSFKNGLAISYEKLGALYQTLGKLNMALELFQKRNQLSEELYRDFPDQVEFIYSLANSYLWLGYTYKANGEIEKSLIFYQKALPIIENLYQKVPIPEYEKQLNRVKNALTNLENP